MKTLKTIQTLANIGKVFSQIIFICCIVFFCLCGVGAVSMALGAQTLKLGGVTLHSLVEAKSMSMGTVYAAIARGMILCAGESVLAKFAQRYFAQEVADGTPFTLSGAAQLMKLGIETICIPIATQIAAAIAHGVIEQLMPGVAKVELAQIGSISLGVTFILVSLICRYGAELSSSPEKGEN